MGYRHDRDELLDAAVAVALEDGLHALSFGRVGRRLGISDRTVVYYFPTKDDLVTNVVLALGARLQDVLESAFGPDPRPPDQLVARAWPVLASPSSDPVFRIFFEAVGLASAGRPPYGQLVPLLVEGWVEWLAPRVEGTTEGERRSGARAVVAQLDGLLLLRLVAGPRTANDAARRLGVLDA